MNNFAVSIRKFESGSDINEDSAVAEPSFIAVSDGAGGGGLFADRWSSFLTSHLPDSPISSADELERWLTGIWEQFYDEAEAEAQKRGGIYLDKFYDEGAFATLVAVWQSAPDKFSWISFGDSVAFAFNRRTHSLQHSFSSLQDFSRPPALINCKDPLRKERFCSGTFTADPDTVVFCASDALSHYFIMRYEAEHQGDERLASDLFAVANGLSRNAIYVNSLLADRPSSSLADELERVFFPLASSGNYEALFSAHMQHLEQAHLLGHDDYSFAMFVPQSLSADAPMPTLSRKEVRWFRRCLRRSPFASVVRLKLAVL